MTFSQRNLPAKGFRPGILLLGMSAVMGYGWYKLIHGIREAKYVHLYRSTTRLGLSRYLSVEPSRELE